MRFGRGRGSEGKGKIKGKFLSLNKSVAPSGEVLVFGVWEV
jgi:hypothetical protein